MLKYQGVHENQEWNFQKEYQELISCPWPLKLLCLSVGTCTFHKTWWPKLSLMFTPLYLPWKWGEEKGRGEGGSSKVHCEDSIVRVKVLAGCPWRVDFVFHWFQNGQDSRCIVRPWYSSLFSLLSWFYWINSCTIPKSLRQTPSPCSMECWDDFQSFPT